MGYHINAENIGLGALRERIEATDHIPSRACLVDGIEERFALLEQYGVTTLASLRERIKTSGRLASVSEATGIDANYLVLLRREIEGYFPKPVALRVFVWLPADEIVKLEQHEIGNTAILYEAAGNASKRSELAQSTGVDISTLDQLYQLADLMRIQWVSPPFARMLVLSGYESAAKVKAASAHHLCEAIARINTEGRFYKGKIGLRDIHRLVRAASYV